MRSSRDRRLGFILTLAFVAVMPVVHELEPAFAGNSTLQLSIDHAPGTEDLPAGEDYTLTATVRSLCVTGCGGIPIELHYETPWGTTETIAKTPLPHALEQSVEFTIPGNAVRWWNTQTRVPYVFAYYLEAEQLQGVNGLETARSPSAGKHERGVVNRLVTNFAKPDGTPLAADWELFVYSDLSADAIRTSVASGQANANGDVKVEIPASTAVVSAAQVNDNLPNFVLHFGSVDGSGDKWFGMAFFFANFGNTRQGKIAANSIVPTLEGERLNPCILPADDLPHCELEPPDAYDAYSCYSYNGGPSTTTYPKRDGWVNNIRYSYGLITHPTYGYQKADSQIQIGVRDQYGNWGGEGTWHVGSASNGRRGTEFASCVANPGDRMDVTCDDDTYYRKWTTYFDSHYERGTWWNYGVCEHYAIQRPGDWNTAGIDEDYKYGPGNIHGPAETCPCWHYRDDSLGVNVPDSGEWQHLYPGEDWWGFRSCLARISGTSTPGSSAPS